VLGPQVEVFCLLFCLTGAAGGVGAAGGGDAASRRRPSRSEDLTILLASFVCPPVPSALPRAGSPQPARCLAGVFSPPPRKGMNPVER